jgi:WD40 repeat protein/serine/threonine protein kinase
MTMSAEPIDEKSVFNIARRIHSRDLRAEYLQQACGGNPEALDRIAALLQVHDEERSFLEVPAVAVQATTDQQPPERPGAQIGPYKLLQQIGEGGMGVVYMAEQHEPVKRRVALKIIKPGMDTRQVIARFEAERQALALMDHVNIARVLDAGTTESGRPYFVMELVNGVPITQYCDENRFTPRQRLELFVPVCQAIQHAHQKGIIHRDIKPTNVMVTLYDGQPVPKVIDFGVAKATELRLTEQTLFTQYGTLVGTLEYMSPEQAEMSALGVDTRSDIYSLGVLLFELLTGSTPLSRQRIREATFGEVLRLIKEEEPPRPSTRLSEKGEHLASISAQRHSEPAKLSKLVRGELDWIVMKTLEKDRNRRYETASGLAADVQRFLNDEPVQACPPSMSYTLQKFVRRNRGAVTASLALATLLVLGTVGTSIGLAWALRAEHTASKAAGAEILAKNKLKQTLDNERVDAYFRRIALAYRELSVDNLGLAQKLLDECPEDLRNWEWHFLMRLCRVEQVVLRNGAGVTSLAFSTDGERIASADLAGTLKVWNSRTGKVILHIEMAHGVSESKPGFISSVAFQPDGEHLASTGEDRLVKVWDLTTKLPVFSRPCDALHTLGNAYTVAFNPVVPNQLAVGSEGAATIWDWKTDQVVCTYPAQGTQRISVAFSPDGRQLASGNWAGSVKLWNAEHGHELLRSFPETRQPVAALSFSPDASRLATASFGRRVDVWNTKTGDLVQQFLHRGHLVLGVAFSPDGRLIVSTGEDKAVHVWEAKGGREVLALRGHTAACGCVAFSPDGLRLASASLDGTIHVWDATPLLGHERQEMVSLLEPSGEVWSLAVSPDGQRIASSGFRNPAKVWDVETRQVTAKLPGHQDVAFCVGWHSDGRIASAHGSGDQFTVQVWKPPSDQREQSNQREQGEEFSLPVGREYTTAAFSTDGRFLVTGRGNGKVQIWDARNGQPIRDLGAHVGPVRGVVFCPNGKYLASASADGKVNLWDATRLGETDKTGPQEPLRTFPVHCPVLCVNVAFSPDGKRIAIGSTENRVVIWEVETGQELKTLRGHSGDVYTVTFSPDQGGRWVASAGEDSTVKVWDSETGKLVRSFRGHTGLVNTLAFARSGQRLVTGSRDGTLKFWDLTQFGESQGGSPK